MYCNFADRFYFNELNSMTCPTLQTFSPCHAWRCFNKHSIKEYEPENYEGLVKTLKQLATDSSKAKSKKDRKEQR